MGLWVDILKNAAAGDLRMSRRLLLHDLPLLLLAPSAEAGARFSGPVPRAVRAFIARLPQSERPAARLQEEELISYIVDDVQTGVEKPLLLIELCLAQPSSNLDGLAAAFAWEPRLKRSAEWKRGWIADMLRSLIEAGVNLPAPIVKSVEGIGEARYGFNEIEYATSAQRLEYSWIDFKRMQGLDAQFLEIIDGDEEEETYAEAMRYGAITAAELTLRTTSTVDAELNLDLRALGEGLSGELTSVLDEFNTRKPKDGYPAIAWHNVFWDMHSEYPRLRMNLKMSEPLCETDNELCQHIAAHYPEVEGNTRPTILRRRRKLHGECEDRIHRRVRDLLG